jgi:uncharacterized membrane protein YheB (UPF0754 family)
MQLLQVALYLPIAGSVIGLITKWAAIKLVFWPPEFVGIGPVGWQGIVQRRSPKFAAGVADTVAGDAIDVNDMLRRIDGTELASVIEPHVREVAFDLARAALAAVGATDPEPQAVASLADRLPGHMATATKQLVGELSPIVASTLDVRGLVIEMLSGRNADRLARLTKSVAAHELRWVIWYGGILGFAIGAVGIVGVTLFERWWMLPVIGAVDGLVNNYLAIQMIFRPLERTRYLGVFSYQGLFAARQAEISEAYGAMMAEEVLHPSVLVDHLAAEASSLLPVALPAIDNAIAPLAGDVADLLGVEAGDDVRQRLVFGLLPALPPVLAHARPELETALASQLAVAETIRQSLAAMPKEEFEHVLRGIFEEDEATLIALGGVLGAGIGALQAGLLVALGWA